MRRFWRGDGGTVSELATRLSGSNDLYAHNGRQPYASINFITAHDGFTLNDLVSYNDKHNEANREDNRDGENNNLSWNCGAEGPTDDPAIDDLRSRQDPEHARDAAPLAGRADDQPRRRARSHAGRQQQRLLSGQRDHVDRLESDGRPASCSASSRASWFTSPLAAGAAPPKVFPGPKHPWLEGRRVARADGREMDDEAWNADFVRSVGMLLTGNAIEEVNERGELIVGDSLLVLLNAHNDKVAFTLPPLGEAQKWQRILDTRDPAAPDRTFKPSARYPLGGRAVAVLKVTPPIRDRRRSFESSRTATPASVVAEAPEPVGAEG